MSRCRHAAAVAEQMKPDGEQDNTRPGIKPEQPPSGGTSHQAARLRRQFAIPPSMDEAMSAGRDRAGRRRKGDRLGRPLYRDDDGGRSPRKCGAAGAHGGRRPFECRGTRASARTGTAPF